MTMRRPLLLSLVCALLAACQGLPTAPAESAAPDKPAAADPTLPKVPLTGEVLFFTLLGEIAGHRGQLEASVSALSRSAQKTRDPRIVERATLAALYARRPQEALGNAQLWVELRPASNEAREALAAALMENGKPDEARQQFEILLARAGSANLAQAYLRIATVLGRQSNRSEALTLMRQLADLNPSQPAAQFALAHLAVRVSDLATATQAIDRALETGAAMTEPDLAERLAIAAQVEALKLAMQGDDGQAVKRALDALNQGTGEFAARRMDASVKRALKGHKLEELDL